MIMTAEEMLSIFSKIKDECERYERIEATPEEVVNKIIDLVAPIDTTPVE